MNKKQLYESIMRQVSIEVKKVLNESNYSNNQAEYIDLGLPSGLKWAKYNMGAFPGNDPEDWYGDYYAWGETESKMDYSWESYGHSKNSKYITLTKYNNMPYYGEVDNKIMLDFKDDAVHQKLNTLRMPTKDEFEELLNNTNNYWAENYDDIHGLNGYVFKSKINDNHIFIPAAGYFDGDGLYEAEYFGELWSRQLCTEDPASAWYISFYSHSIDINYDSRCLGLPVRGVCE